MPAVKKQNSEMGLISIEGMEFYAYHGCFQEEKQIGTKFILDIHLDAPTYEAEKTDDLSKTINYQEVYSIIKKEMEHSSDLLEHVGRRILTVIRDAFPQIDEADITVSKINPSIGGKIKRVSVSLSLSDEE
ncbi:MAG: dihydroneopterin aldolase [Bacteroidales bacterium]